jgi:hypothetical protein
MTTANVSSLEAAVARVKELQATKPGIEAKKLRACLTLEDYSDKIIAEAMKTLGIKNNASGLMTFPAVINWLGEEPRKSSMRWCWSAPPTMRHAGSMTGTWSA